MIYKTIVTSNSKLKYVVVLNNTLSNKSNNCAFIYIFNDSFFFILSLPLHNLMLNKHSNDIYLGNSVNTISSLIRGNTNLSIFNKLNRLFYS